MNFPNSNTANAPGRASSKVQDGVVIDGFSEVHGLGVEVDFFYFGVGSHHEVLAPEKNREHSIRDQRAALNVGFMERLGLSE